MKQLPTSTHFHCALDEDKFANSCTMAFLCADVTYQLMHDSCEMLLHARKDLKHDTKKRFNQFIDAMDKAKKASCRVGEDAMNLKDEQVEYYFDDADYVKKAICLIYEKTKMGQNDNAQKIMDFLCTL